MSKQPVYAKLVHSPADLASMHVEHAKHILADPGIKWGLPGVDQVVIPQRPGNMTVICGRPGHGKSTLLARQAKLTAASLEPNSGQCVIYVTWEQTAEELEAFFASSEEYTSTDYAWGRVPIETIQKRVVHRASLPLWVIGHSLKHAGTKMPQMTPEVVYGAIETLATDFAQPFKPRLLCLDYMQLIPVMGRHASKVERINDAVIQAKHLAMRVGCPVMIAVQAARAVDDRKIKIPQERDAQWCSAIEQTTDKFFGVWRPYKTEEQGKPLIFQGHNVEITPDLFVLQMSKQRFDEGRHTWLCSFSPAELRLVELELDVEELEEMVW